LRVAATSASAARMATTAMPSALIATFAEEASPPLIGAA
jgi:hypothetical protein